MSEQPDHSGISTRHRDLLNRILVLKKQQLDKHRFGPYMLHMNRDKYEKVLEEDYRPSVQYMSVHERVLHVGGVHAVVLSDEVEDMALIENEAL